MKQVISDVPSFFCGTHPLVKLDEQTYAAHVLLADKPLGRVGAILQALNELYEGVMLGQRERACNAQAAAIVEGAKSEWLSHIATNGDTPVRSLSELFEEAFYDAQALAADEFSPAMAQVEAVMGAVVSWAAQQPAPQAAEAVHD